MESEVGVRGRQCVGRGWKNNGWGILAAENGAPSPLFPLELSSALTTPTVETERGPQAAFGLGRELIGALWLTRSEKRRILTAPAGWRTSVKVCALPMPCVASLSHRSGLRHPARVQELIYRLWHRHMSASERHGEFWQQIRRCRSCAPFIFISGISGIWWVKVETLTDCEIRQLKYAQDERLEHSVVIIIIIMIELAWKFSSTVL